MWAHANTCLQSLSYDQASCTPEALLGKLIFLASALGHNALDFLVKFNNYTVLLHRSFAIAVTALRLQSSTLTGIAEQESPDRFRDALQHCV